MGRKMMIEAAKWREVEPLLREFYSTADVLDEGTRCSLSRLVKARRLLLDWWYKNQEEAATTEGEAKEAP